MTLNAQTGSGPKGHVIEIVSFRLIDGADPGAFRDAARKLDGLLQDRGSAVARTLAVDEEGLWTDIVEWTSMDEAKSAAEDLVKDPLFATFGAMIDGPSVHLRHAPVQHQME